MKKYMGGVILVDLQAWWVGEHLAGAPTRHYIVVNLTLNSGGHSILRLTVKPVSKHIPSPPRGTTDVGRLCPQRRHTSYMSAGPPAPASRASAQALYRPGSIITSGTDEGRPTREAMCPLPKLAGPVVWGHQATGLFSWRRKPVVASGRVLGPGRIPRHTK